MQALPSGTVTFLFTDIEGSTRLIEQHPDSMEEAQARHNALLKSAIDAHRGYVFQIVGDAFCKQRFKRPAHFRLSGNAGRGLDGSLNVGENADEFKSSKLRIRIDIDQSSDPTFLLRQGLSAVVSIDTSSK